MSLIRHHLEYATPVWDPHCVYMHISNQSSGNIANVLLEEYSL